jgi:hypothetical protein
MKDQNQKAGDNSTNVQAGTIIVNQGLSVLDVKALALDVFRDNFIELKGAAQDVARQRAEEITEIFLARLMKENASGLRQAESPDFQYAVYTVQQEYARCGDSELGDLLVDLLVDRTKEGSRSVLQIVLNESLAVAPKLTADQMAALSVIFLFKYTINHSVVDLPTLGNYLDRYILPLQSHLTDKHSTFQHLEYCGCGTVGMMSVVFADVFRQTYGGSFSKGFDVKRLSEMEFSAPVPDDLVTDCLTDPSKRQLSAINEKVLRSGCEQLGVSDDDTQRLVQLFNESLMDHAETKATLIQLRPYMQRVFDVWQTTSMNQFTLTSVGIAIGHANIKKSTGEFTNLSIWIN